MREESYVLLVHSMTLREGSCKSEVLQVKAVLNMNQKLINDCSMKRMSHVPFFSTSIYSKHKSEVESSIDYRTIIGAPARIYS